MKSVQQTGSGLVSLPSICMRWKYLRHFRIIFLKIMKSTVRRSSAALALLLLIFATVIEAHHYSGCNCDSCSQEPSPIPTGAEIVTYGEPCFCKEPLPYSIQVPKVNPRPPVESLKSYGYSVITPPSHKTPRPLQLPVQIQTPIVGQPCYDVLRGKSYGVSVQHEAYPVHPVRYNLDCAIQRPVKVQKMAHAPSMAFSVHEVAENFYPQYAPLPCTIETPIYEKPKSIPRLTGLTPKVDRVLVPACEVPPVCPDVDYIPRPRMPPPKPCVPPPTPYFA